MIERIEDTGRHMKALVACRECGQLYGLFFTETNYIDGYEDMLNEMVQVYNREDLEALTAAAGPAWKGRPYAHDFRPQGEEPRVSSGIHDGSVSLAALM